MLEIGRFDLHPKVRFMSDEFIRNTLPVVLFFVGVLIAFGVSFLSERYRR
jgi:hypothetical protein